MEKETEKTEIILTISEKNSKKIKNPSTFNKIYRSLAKIYQSRSSAKMDNVVLERNPNNPIIVPGLHSWESKATFNPGAFEVNGKIHLVYRAVGDDDTSVFGYASSYDGITFSERCSNPIYKKPELKLKSNFVSGPKDVGWKGGCEDPRLVLIGDTLYMTYTSFAGWESLRMTLTSIKFSDFEQKKWNWKNPVLISLPNEINKNWVLFPEKINGKFAILHSFYPKILIDYFDSLDELDGKKFIKSDNTRPANPNRTWDRWFRGVGPAPVKIKEGWLILYHATNYNNPERYRIGALILDSNDPTKIIYRSNQPILEPDEWYENEGYKKGVIYACGAVVKDGRLFVYYGGADKVICAASVKLVDLINDLKKYKTIN